MSQHPPQQQPENSKLPVAQTEEDYSGVFESDMFQVDENYFRKPRPARIEVFNIEQSDFEVKVRLLGDHILWGNYLWNASKCLSQHFYENQHLIKDKTVVELGAAGGLPSLTCGKLGAKKVVITDIGHEDLIDNLKKNVELNFGENCTHVEVRPHAWGEKLEETFGVGEKKETFDVIILSDLLFNHICHHQLLDSCEYLSHPNTIIYVSYTHHRPWLIKEDLKLFKLAKERNFSVEHYFDKKYPPMFENDPGDVEERSTVHVQIMRPRHISLN
ncbi:hypothetical protein C9374_001760 [Naegleria lovaniensis]|uniref:Protein N-terminal and lysine N-methyltransferase EFM7 n=1 Tax=Naegleria lovaniensis TaxID=51637 RepID=A0AA88KMB9_NAELO|nr:uncharacterized protein C9374_001760 [Naegleria lovaniensis]KAG2387428.1 hypothetical protein C9374_001760 [Naegleria lovaniensis]